MKKLTLVTVIIFLLINQSFAQIEKTKYSVIDEISRTYRQLFVDAKTVEVHFRLVSIENLVNEEILFGIEIEVNSSELKSISNSLSFYNYSDLWDFSINTAYEKLNRNGVILLDPAEALEAFDFLNERIGKTLNTAPTFYESHKISINERIEMGYYYDKKNGKEWRFFTSIDDIVFETEVMKGIDLIKKLREFANYPAIEKTVK